jgi:hypothetical protein
MNAGHFFPEEVPEQTADLLARFFASTGKSGVERSRPPG